MSLLSSNGKPDKNKVIDVILSLGSNVGEREWNIIRGVNMLSGCGGIEAAGLSSLYESEPEGSGFSGRFVNAVALVKTIHPPERFLDLCQRVERRAGRVHAAACRDRTLDIDIIFFGGLVIDTERLKVPHGLYRNREFVLKPLQEAAPEMLIPPDNIPVSVLLDRLGNPERVRKISARAII
ncbi:MAG: 2-amino-4-hydroxy-6-hydroxymethyldihydropteridine diphosphokinase [Candidatus Krumholzibacteriota bacterium]|nr:2-amino-4-hydroxy-6-hydroxymethyldihydropteridine diphosphokinase [Candidatus Krumholzibacteriota bacterium]